MADPTITVTPNPASVSMSATASASWGTPPAGDVVVQVFDETTNPPTLIASRTFSSDPYDLDFTPVNTGQHRVKVTWRNGLDTADQGFQVV